MINGQIKGDGTSRLLKSYLPDTYDEFKTLMASGQLPVDVLFNPIGWSILPTFLNKGALLKDATAALYNLGTDAVPDDVLALIKPMIDSNYAELSSLANSKAKIDTGSYVGTGEYYKTLTFPQLPKFVFIHDAGGYSAAMFISIVNNVAGVRVITNGNHVVKKGTISGNSISWSMRSGEDMYAMNANKTTYYWISIT